MVENWQAGMAAEMADCLMAREGLLNKRWSYDYGVVWRGMEMLFGLTGQERYERYIRDAMDTFVDRDGGIRDYEFGAFNLDYICNGRQLLYLYKRTGEPQYGKAADMLYDQLRRQPRTSDGGFWHKLCYPWQMWLDGLHMAAPFYLEYALMKEDSRGIADAAGQLLLAYAHTLDPESGLNRHAWDERRAQPWADPNTGLAAHAWGRAMGWYIVALVDCLEMMPPEHSSFQALRSVLGQMVDTLLSARREGVWMQVLDCPGRLGNYPESSASCMMAYALLKAARLGLVSDRIQEEARASFLAVVRHFVGRMRNGQLFLAKCCQGAGLGGSSGRDGSFDYYISEPVVSYDLKGTGAFIQAACEMERLHEVH